MNILRNHWYDIGLIPMFGALICLIIFWHDIDMLRKLALMNFAVIFWHQFEEYHFPGGEPAVTNLAMQPKSLEHADRYPLNQNNVMIINGVGSYIVYSLPVIFPNTLWLGVMPILFGMMQMVIHVIATPKKIGNRIYSPGTAAVVFGHIPIGIYWFYYTISNGMLGMWDVIFGVIYQILFVGVFMIKIGYGILSKPDSSYPFPIEEFERHGYAERIRK